MSFFDLIRDLRTREPNIAEASKAMAVIGWFCLLIGVWNFIVPSLMPFDRGPFNLPPNYPVFSFALFSLLMAFQAGLPPLDFVNIKGKKITIQVKSKASPAESQRRRETVKHEKINF